jgi:hypothetical protein
MGSRWEILKDGKHLGYFETGRTCVILAMAFLCDVLTVIWKSF